MCEADGMCYWRKSKSFKPLMREIRRSNRLYRLESYCIHFIINKNRNIDWGINWEKWQRSKQKRNVDIICNRSQVANDSRLLICPERFAGSNPAGCAKFLTSNWKQSKTFNHIYPINLFFTQNCLRLCIRFWIFVVITRIMKVKNNSR